MNDAPPPPTETDAPPRPAPPPLWKCPDCERLFESPAALTDHSLTEHVDAEAPTAAIRPVKSKLPYRIALGVVALLGVATIVFFALGGAGVFDKETVPETPSSSAHKIAAGVVASGEAEDYRAVEPDSGWDAEYEVDGDGYVRSRGSGFTEEVEVESFDLDLRDALEDEASDQGFDFD